MSKAHVNLLMDERWDALIGGPGDGRVVEVEAATLSRWRAAIQEYGDVQREMLAAMDAADAAEDARKPPTPEGMGGSRSSRA